MSKDSISSQEELVRSLLSSGAVRRASALRNLGVASVTLTRMVESGEVEKVSRGVYRMADADPVENQSFAEVSARVKNAVVCLESAAAFHGMADGEPDAVQIGLPYGSRTPEIDYPPVEVVRWRRRQAMTAGVDEIEIAGQAVRITTPARTVVDLFRHVTKIPTEVGLKALAAYVGMGGTPSELRKIARELGAEGYVEPFLEVMQYMAAPDNSMR